MKYFATGICALAIIALTGCASTDPIDTTYGPFQEWDIDNDGNVEDAEFAQRIAEREYYLDWDQNDDGMINESEFEAGVFYSYAGDNDVVTAAEFQTGIDAWYGDMDDAGVFTDWDMNDDDMVDWMEFEEGMNTYPIYGDWDADDDDMLMEEEFADGVYVVWDLDGDGMIDEVEFNRGYDTVYFIE